MKSSPDMTKVVNRKVTQANFIQISGNFAMKVSSFINSPFSIHFGSINFGANVPRKQLLSLILKIKRNLGTVKFSLTPTDWNWFSSKNKLLISKNMLKRLFLFNGMFFFSFFLFFYSDVKSACHM